jgi:NAD(P)-dependent dehydrogenase (short-subunit alcohol dehydrogenase family)
MAVDMVVMNAGGSALPALKRMRTAAEHIVRSNALWLHGAAPVCQKKQQRHHYHHHRHHGATTCTTFGRYRTVLRKLAVPLSTAYAASKFAIKLFSSLACERPICVLICCVRDRRHRFHRNNNNNDSSHYCKTIADKTAPSK